MRKIHVVHDYDGLYSRFWGRLGEIVPEDFFRAHPEEVSLCAFTGGSDISPEIYGHRNLASHNDPRRDAHEQGVFRFAQQHQIPMTGICRGSQFLCGMTGGTMIQDLPSHGGSRHIMISHDGEEILVTSSHHQMSIPNQRSVVCGWAKERVLAKRCTYDGELPKWLYDPQDAEKIRVVEAWADPDRRIFAVQHHPEWQTGADRAWPWTLDMIRHYCLLEKAAQEA